MSTSLGAEKIACFGRMNWYNIDYMARFKFDQEVGRYESFIGTGHQGE